ncbi:hypothetical protein D3C71_924890 [compost metagenome]
MHAVGVTRGGEFSEVGELKRGAVWFFFCAGRRTASKERTGLHLQGIAGLALNEHGKDQRIHVTLYDHSAVERYPRSSDGPLKECDGVCKSGAIERPVLAEGEPERDRLPTPAGATNALAVGCQRGRNVGHHDVTDRTDIHSHFHGCRTVEHVDLTALELGFVLAQAMRRLLSRMLCRPEIICEQGDTIGNIRPSAGGTKVSDHGIRVQPIAD